MDICQQRPTLSCNTGFPLAASSSFPSSSSSFTFPFPSGSHPPSTSLHLYIPSSSSLLYGQTFNRRREVKEKERIRERERGRAGLIQPMTLVNGQFGMQAESRRCLPMGIHFFIKRTDQRLSHCALQIHCSVLVMTDTHVTGSYNSLEDA